MSKVATEGAPVEQDRPRRTVMSSVTGFFTELMRKYLPDPFVFAIGLTLLTLLMAVTIEGQGFLDMADAWGTGFWDLLAFTTQMAVILVAGYVLASAPVTDRMLDRIVAKVRTPRQAIIVATLVGAVGSYINWGFGLMIGGVVAKKLALGVRGVHHPLIIASAYSGFTLYGLGLSATIPVTIAAEEHPLVDQMGVVPLSETIFSAPMLIPALVTVTTLPLLNAWLHPRPGQPVKEIDRERVASGVAAAVRTDVDLENTVAAKLNNSRILALAIGVLGIVFVVLYFADGRALNINIINFIVLFLGIILMGTPARYVAKFGEGIKTASGIVLQFPFYAGILGIMAASGLVVTISELFVSVSGAETLPFWGIVSSFVINFFAPSAGGHWIIQGPFMMEAATALDASYAQTAMSVQLGNAWNDLVQPFWILPALALSGLKLKDIMGYTVIMMFYVGVLYCGATLLWGFLG